MDESTHWWTEGQIDRQIDKQTDWLTDRRAVRIEEFSSLGWRTDELMGWRTDRFEGLKIWKTDSLDEQTKYKYYKLFLINKCDKYFLIPSVRLLIAVFCSFTWMEFSYFSYSNFRYFLMSKVFTLWEKFSRFAGLTNWLSQEALLLVEFYLLCSVERWIFSWRFEDCM